MRIQLQLCLAGALAVALTSAGANTCGIERVVRSGSELTVLFNASQSYFYYIDFRPSSAKSCPGPTNDWQPFAVATPGEVLYENCKAVLKRPYLRMPADAVLVLSEHHYGCNAAVTADGQKLRVKHGGGMVGSADLSSVQEIEIEVPVH